jgi:hypothetical protein
MVCRAVAVEADHVNATQSEAGPLKGARILVIEDEFLIATVVEDVLKDAGARQVVIALNLQGRP